VASRPFARIATRLHSASASLSTWELKNTGDAAVAEEESARPNITSAERVEAGHRLIEDYGLRIVDECLRDTHAAASFENLRSGIRRS
jgi:hypothetical protein